MLKHKNINILSLSAFFMLVIALIATSFSHKALAASCNIPSTNYGTDSLTLNVPSSGNYYLWIEMQSPASSSNSIEAQLNGSTCFNVGGNSNMPLNSWNWINYQDGSTSNIMSAQLSAGTNSLELIGIQPGIMVNTVELLSDSSCVPSGSGSNCAPTNVSPPTVSVSSPISGSSVSGSSVPIDVSAASAPGISQVGISYVVIKIDGTIIATDTTAPYTASWNTNNYTNGSHTITVVATDSQGQSTSSSESVNVNNYVGCTAVTSAPSALTAQSNTYSSITLRWSSGSIPSNCSLSHYNLYQNGQLIAQPSSSPFTLNANPNSIYDFSLTESDSFGTSGSTTLSVTTPADTIPPTNPVNPVASVKGSNQVVISWGASTDSSGIANYRIYRNGQFLGSTSSLSYTDNSVSPNTTYTYLVSAVDNLGNVSNDVATVPASVTTPKLINTTPPTAPASLKVDIVTSTSVDLSWQSSTDSGATVIGYKVYRSGQYLTTVKSPSFTDSNLSPDTSYVYTVQALASNGTTSSNSSISVKTLPNPVKIVASCSLDLNHDGIVDVYDGSIMFAHWHIPSATCAMGDFNHDGIVNSLDAQILFSHWGEKV